MADILVNHLKEKASEHSALQLLLNQWGFDEKLIPKALQLITNLFTQYSRHDESHSKQILINIERILGQENIDKLTATDTWLLLEAAYWHDIGMVVTHKSIMEALSSEEFLQYIDLIRNDPNHELNRFALTFNSYDMSKCFAGADTPVEAMDMFFQLMSNWFRQQHADRTNIIIQSPWDSAGISSPRTELIPNRLFRLLGCICHMHGLPFKELLIPSGLPYRDAGLAQDDCHPRFVACLLRMGDLLDLDDNRFCPVMQRVVGENRSLISKAHEEKHTSIRHLRVDRERIEITAECVTIDGYLETFKWFDWLKQEMQDQMAHWQDIVPSREFGLLPTLGDIVVRLSGEQQILNEGQRPQFSVDGEQAIKLLQGNNLYSTKYACVRELLQNAVDATLLRLWLTENRKQNQETWKNPFSESVQAILEKGFVEVKLNEITSASDISTEKTRWNLNIIDYGIGISRNDLAYMLTIGGSQRNVFRQSKINSMPEWMKPSGSFGIGFQSVFLICDFVKLITKSIFTNETIEVTMYSPTGNEEGLVLIKPLENDISQHYGTSIEISFSLEKITKNFSLNISDNTSIAVQFLNTFDPVLDTSLPIEAAQLSDEIQQFAQNAPLAINGKLTTTKDARVFQIGTTDNGYNNFSRDWRFVDVNNNQIALQYKPILSGHFNNIITLYRGQPFEQKCLHLPNIEICINILSGKAGKWLTANREKLINSAEVEFRDLVISALQIIVSEDLASIDIEKESKETLAILSYFLETMSLCYGEKWTTLASKLAGKWLHLKTENESAFFLDFFQRKSWILGIETSSNAASVTECDLIIRHQYGLYLKDIIINEWLKNENRTVQVIESAKYPTNGDILRYKFASEPQPLYSDGALATCLARTISRLVNNHRFYLDFHQGTYSVLYLKSNTKLRASYLFSIPRRGNSKYVLLPFLFCNGRYGEKSITVTASSDQIKALCEWVLPHLETPTTIDEIYRAYNELINYLDNSIMKNSPYWDTWKKARKL